MTFKHSILRYSLRYIWRQKWQTLLLVLGILLGVAVVIAIDYANQSSRKAITLSTQSVTGKSTHQIVSSGEGISDEFFSSMKRKGVFDTASPILEGYIRVDNFGQQTYLLLGIDPLLDFPFRSYYGQTDIQLAQMLSIISEPGTAIISKDLAEEFGIELGEEISYQFEGVENFLRVVGFVESNEPVLKETIKGTILVDISTAQATLNKIGLIDRIELILETEEQEKRIKIGRASCRERV